MTQVEAFWAGQCLAPWWPLQGLVHGKVAWRMPPHVRGDGRVKGVWSGVVSVQIPMGATSVWGCYCLLKLGLGPAGLQSSQFLHFTNIS
jgi:hypothetical protein